MSTRTSSDCPARGARASGQAANAAVAGASGDSGRAEPWPSGGRSRGTKPLSALSEDSALVKLLMALRHAAIPDCDELHTEAMKVMREYPIQFLFGAATDISAGHILSPQFQNAFRRKLTEVGIEPTRFRTLPDGTRRMMKLRLEI